MLNKDNIRELAYLVIVDEIRELPGYDRVESARVGGWWCIVPKGQFQPGSIGIYFEIDSRVPATNPAFDFMAKRNYKVKTQKMCKSISQGLLMAPEDFGWEVMVDGSVDTNDGDHGIARVDDESRFLTQRLGVIYAEAADNERKGVGAPDKYKKMAQRHPAIFRKPFVRKMMRTKLGREILYMIFGRKKEKKTSFPTHFQYIKPTDEERIENCVHLLEDKDEWVKTTKIDGTSSTYILERLPHGKFEFYVLSRHVRQLKVDQECFHGENVYWQVEEKYHIQDCLRDLLDAHPEWDYVCIQGETAGVSNGGVAIQGNPHDFTELRFFGYNFITSDVGRWETPKAAEFLKKYEIPWVPIVDEHYVLPDDMETFKLSADGNCEAPGASGLREGYVYRRATFKEDAMNSFKNVSREYLLSRKD